MNSRIAQLGARASQLLLAFIFAGSVLIPPAQAAKKKHVTLKPDNAQHGITIVSLGKNRTYYALRAKQPTVVSTKGPGELRVLTRACFTADGKNELAYRIVYRVDGAEVQTFDAVSVPSQNARYKDARLGAPGDSKDIRIKVGLGYHTIELVLSDSLPAVSARFLFIPRKQKKMKWVSLCPLAPVEPVDLFAGESTAHYYRFSKDKPLRVEIIGPTALRVLTRVENSFDMKGRVRYRVRVSQGGQVLRTFQLSSRRSETTTYKKNSKLIPGKAREIVFSVPKGQYRYEIVPLDNDTMLGQILFPLKDAKLGL